MTLPAPTNPASPEELELAQSASSLTGDEHLKWASQEEALAGTETAKMISPATLAYTLENTPAVTGPEIDDTSSSLIKVWSARKLTESVGDTAEMLDGILGDGTEIEALKGDDGAAGLSVLSGPYDPTIEGVDGEFWINTTSWQIFGPKSEGTWGSGTAIKGEDGTDGTDGNTVLSGASDPTTEGVVGDWYINTTSLQIFGPKTAEGWGTGTDLKGADGADGAIGPTFSISEDHFFADATARDAYFTSNPSELVAGVVISNEAGSTGYQQYSGSAWLDKEFAVAGGGGAEIDDTIESLVKTWSSSHISAKLTPRQIVRGLLDANMSSASGTRSIPMDTTISVDTNFYSVDENGYIEILASGVYIVTYSIHLNAQVGGFHSCRLVKYDVGGDVIILIGNQLNTTTFEYAASGVVDLSVGDKVILNYYSSSACVIAKSGMTYLRLTKIG